MTGNGWIDLTVAFTFFAVSHAVHVRPTVRQALAGRMGEGTYLLAYSLAARHAPYVELWAVQKWHMWVPRLVMPTMCQLTVSTPNPLSFGGAAPETFDPDQPGIAGVARHPLLLALALWSLSHLFANVDLAHVLVFGSAAAFALAGMLMIDRRRKRHWGKTEWSRLATKTLRLPFAALLSGCWHPDPRRLKVGAIVRPLASIVLYLGLVALHDPLMGVAAIPAS
jgi:uncharacterized membrane protein